MDQGPLDVNVFFMYSVGELERNVREAKKGLGADPYPIPPWGRADEKYGMFIILVMTAARVRLMWEEGWIHFISTVGGITDWVATCKSLKNLVGRVGVELTAR